MPVKISAVLKSRKPKREFCFFKFLVIFIRLSHMLVETERGDARFAICILYMEKFIK